MTVPPFVQSVRENKSMSKQYKLSLSMTFTDEYIDEIAEPMTEEETVEYFKTIFLDDIAEGINGGFLVEEYVDVEVINE